MNKISKEDIEIISQNSNWRTEGISAFLSQHVYNDVSSWKKFLQVLLLTLGLGFSTAGVVFFFAPDVAR